MCFHIAVKVYVLPASTISRLLFCANSPTPYDWEHRQDMRPGSQRSVITSVVGDQRRLHSINLKTDDLRTNVGRSQDDEAARCLRRFRGRKRSLTSSRDISARKGEPGDGNGRRRPATDCGHPNGDEVQTCRIFTPTAQAVNRSRETSEPVVTYGEVNSPRVSQKWNLPLRSVFNQIASMEPEIDCNVPSMLVRSVRCLCHTASYPSCSF